MFALKIFRLYETNTQRIPSCEKPLEALFTKELLLSLSTKETSIALKLFS